MSETVHSAPIIQEGIDVATAELLLNGVDVKIEVIEGKTQKKIPFPGYHTRSTLVIIDGLLCRVTTRHGKKDRFGN